MNRYTKSFSFTLILYLAIFISFLYAYEDEKQIQTFQKKSEQLVKFTIIQETKPMKKEKETVIKKKEKKKTKKIISKKISTKKLKPKELKKKKKVVIKKKEIKKHIPKKIEKEIPRPKQTIIKQQIRQNKLIQKNTLNHQNIIKKHKEKQNKYYTKIKETINKNKTYPRIAIKRGIEGIVKIKFTISKNGKLLSFEIVEGKRVFKKSIEKAIKSSFPLTPPKDLLTSNTSLSLTVDFRLY